MQNLVKTTRNFLRDEEGAFLTIFGLIAIVLIALSGAVVDYVVVEQARNRAQVALDAAALSLQPSIYTDTDVQLTAKSRDLLIQQIANDSIGVEMLDVTTDDVEGTLHLEARLTIPMTFVALVGFTEMQPVIVSEATRKKLFLEVAMVLDNSGSMYWENRMTNLKAAAKSAADILYEYKDPADGGDGSVVDSTFISIVPFNFWVNVGANNINEPWLDQNGLSSASHDGFDNDDNDGNGDFGGPVNRFALYEEMNNVSWKGCVEARPGDYSTNDEEPDVNVPDTLFVPQFAPDEPDDNRLKNGWGDTYQYKNNYLSDTPDACGPTAVCTWNNTRSGCSNFWSCSNETVSYTRTEIDGTETTGGYVCNCAGETQYNDTGWQTWGPWWDQTFHRSVQCKITGLSEAERQERLCKYNNVNINTYKDGPNWDCLDAPILPLTNTRQDVINRIDSMNSFGATNIHMGAAWGFRVLSPTEPFTQGRAYESATYKVAIIMTDGENTYFVDGSDTNQLNGAWVYPPYGYPRYERLGAGTNGLAGWQFADIVDSKLLATCTNMKDAGIEIFTIGLAPPNEDMKTMLRSCASNSSKAYFPEESSELVSVFEEIADQLSDLRLAL